MRSCRIRLDVSAVDAYLYGGYLFLFRSDGALGYVRFERLLGLCVDDNKSDFNDMKLTFLPYQTLKGKSYDFLYELPFVNLALNHEINRVSGHQDWLIDPQTFNSSFQIFSKFDDIPLDVAIYGGEVFMGNSNGLYKSSLNAGIDYKLSPSKLKKIFDGESIHLSSKCGAVAISSAENGLFSYSLVSEKHVKDRPVYEDYSVRSDWSVGNSLLNYSSNNIFSLLINKVGEAEEKLDVPKGFRDDNSYNKSIEIFGEKNINMEQLLQKSKKLEGDLSYVFSGLSSGFFLTSSGDFEVRNLQENSDNIYYSSQKLYSKNISDVLKNETPISAKTFPGGCVIELYDKVLLLYRDEVEILAEEPVFSVRTYMQSSSYRNLISIVYADRVEIIAIPMLPEKGRGASSYKPVSRINSVIVSGEKLRDVYMADDILPPIKNVDFPF